MCQTEMRIVELKKDEYKSIHRPICITYLFIGDAFSFSLFYLLMFIFVYNSFSSLNRFSRDCAPTKHINLCTNTHYDFTSISVCTHNMHASILYMVVCIYYLYRYVFFLCYAVMYAAYMDAFCLYNIESKW